jgi:predicted PurR-regulated permease PerM
MNQFWHSSVRQWIAFAMVAIVVLGLRVLWPYLTPLALALLLTFILIPVVNRVEENLGWPRAAAAAFIYIQLIIAIILIPVLLIPALVNQAQALVPTLIDAVNQLGVLIQENIGPTTIFGQQVDPFLLYQQLSDQILSLGTTLGTRLASSSVNVVFGVATTFFSTVLWLLFMLVISFYIVVDSPNIARYFWGLVPREERPEVYYLTRRINATWSAFLRGQLLLSFAIFVVTTIILVILGMPQPIFLGFLAGLLNLIPNLGPFLSGIPAVILALVQGSSQFEISNVLFALIVVGAYTIIQQLEAQLLVPRIIGGSVNLHPAVVVIGAIIGLSTIGILGIFLAAPTLASLRVLGGYAYRKLLDPDFEPAGVVLPPQIAAIPDPRERPLAPVTIINVDEDPSLVERVRRWVRPVEPPSAPREKPRDV